MTEVIIGSRESKLAVLQSEMVKSYIEQKNREENAGSEITVNILTMKTTGDIINVEPTSVICKNSLIQNPETAEIIDEIENPTIKLFIKASTIVIGNPIIDIPSNQINST